ncbi:unnamed protein product [Lampetra fluviatilis]
MQTSYGVRKSIGWVGGDTTSSSGVVHGLWLGRVLCPSFTSLPPLPLLLLLTQQHKREIRRVGGGGDDGGGWVGGCLRPDALPLSLSRNCYRHRRRCHCLETRASLSNAALADPSAATQLETRVSLNRPTPQQQYEQQQQRLLLCALSAAAYTAPPLPPFLLLPFLLACSSR